MSTHYTPKLVFGYSISPTEVIELMKRIGSWDLEYLEQYKCASSMLAEELADELGLVSYYYSGATIIGRDLSELTTLTDQLTACSDWGELRTSLNQESDPRLHSCLMFY